MSDIFKQYPNMEVYYETSDGTKFYKEETAKTHGRTLDDKSVVTVTKTVKAEILLSKAAEIIGLAPEMALETAKTYLEEEHNREPARTTVIDALNARISELENPED